MKENELEETKRESDRERARVYSNRTETDGLRQGSKSIYCSASRLDTSTRWSDTDERP